MRGFKRISLQPGESVRVTFPIGFADLSFINEQMKEEVEPGEFCAEIGGLQAIFEVK